MLSQEEICKWRLCISLHFRMEEVHFWSKEARYGSIILKLCNSSKIFRICLIANFTMMMCLYRGRLRQACAKVQKQNLVRHIENSYIIIFCFHDLDNITFASIWRNSISKFGYFWFYVCFSIFSTVDNLSDIECATLRR